MFFIKERVKRLLDELQTYIYPKSVQISEYIFKEGQFKGAQAKDFDTTGWETFPSGSRWGGNNLHFWFKASVEIPADFSGHEVVYSVCTGREGQWDALNPQFVVYVNGSLVQGLDVNHREITLTQQAKAGEVFDIALYAYSGTNDGLAELISKISVLNTDVETLYYNLKVPLEIAALLDKDDKKSIDILNFLTEAVNLLDLRIPFSPAFEKSVQMANEYMETAFYGEYCKDDDVIAHCIGHTHIDVAWLWTLAQTREKTVRSFSTVLNLMKRYPEYTFMSSQPQLYQYLKEENPDLFEEVRQRVAEGRWEAEGAMWLEADCNLASGESLVRQILFGTRFFEKEFGVKNKILWLPDVFGYSAAMPQILKKSGIEYFMTTKISWNEYNKMPNDTFLWKGLDGTDILTHFITTSDYHSQSHGTTYVGNLIPTQVMGAWKRYQQKNINHEVMICYGYGDGGGGPTKEMLENARRMEKGIPGCPKIKMGTALDYFEKLEQTVTNNKKLPTWNGELYLEYHRGTYTSMARNKKYNRKSELLYQDAEWLSVMDRILQKTPYPQEKINAGWEKILLNQFHDILPGSSIKQVYEDSRQDYLKVLDTGNTIANNATQNLAKNIALDSRSVVVFNQLSSERSDIVAFALPENAGAVQIKDSDGNLLQAQMVEDGASAVFYAQNIPAKGYTCYQLSTENTQAIANVALSADTSGLSNKFFDIRLDEQGCITSIYDKKAKREVIKKGEKANVLQAFEDKPHNYDAWDINIYYQEKMWIVDEVEAIEVVETGPVRACVRVKKRFLNSVIVQDICIYNDIQRIDFKTRIDWKETQVLLKTAFPVDVYANKATYDIQFGNVERPTHWNTSWDLARFEGCAHKWVDLSENGYGVSLLNDCKYGHDIKDGVIRLTLLKSAKYPNEDADREVHEFSYALYPHEGDWRQAQTPQMAYAFNCPVYTKVEEPHQGNLPAAFSLFSVNSENVVIESVKKSEDNEDIIIRVYECYNRRTNAAIAFYTEPKEVVECDLMEQCIENIPVTGNTFCFEIKPYEIKTFRVRIV